MPNVKAGLLLRVVWMRFSCRGAAHLTRVPVAVKHKRTGLFRNNASKRGTKFSTTQHVLVWLERRQVVMSDDIHALLVPELPHPPCPFTDTSYFTQCVRREHFTDMLLKIGPERRPRREFALGLAHACPSVTNSSCLARRRLGWAKSSIVI